MRTRATVICFVLTAGIATGVPPALAGSLTADAAAEQAQLQRVNDARRAKGLPVLSWNARMASIARDHSFDMARSGDLQHNPRLPQQVGPYQALGENVGYGPDEGGVHEAFMDSESHRENILGSSYTQVGIGAVDDGDLVWITQVFYTPRSEDAGASGEGDGQGATRTRSAEKRQKAERSGARTDHVGEPAPRHVRSVGTVRPLRRASHGGATHEPLAGMRAVEMLDRLVAEDAFVPVRTSLSLIA